MSDRPSCSWCSSRAVARLRVRRRWLGWFTKPRLLPSCATCLVEQGIAFKLAFDWPVLVDVVPYVVDDLDAARMVSAVITHHRNPELT